MPIIRPFDVESKNETIHSVSVKCPIKIIFILKYFGELPPPGKYNKVWRGE